jgi:hypothetical protein
MRIVDELSSFYRHIYLNLPAFTRLVGVAGAATALRFGVFPADVYKIERADERTRTADLLITSALLAIWMRPNG